MWCLYKEVQDYYERRSARAGRRDAAVGGGQLGQCSPAADRRGTQTQRRRRNLLPLRLPRRPAQLSMDQHQPDLPKIWDQMTLAQAIRRRSDLDRQRRPFQGLRVADGIFPEPRLGTRTLDRRTISANFTRLWAAARIRTGEFAADIADIIAQIHQIQRPPQTGVAGRAALTAW